MKFSILDGREDDGHTGIGVVDISNVFATQVRNFLTDLHYGTMRVATTLKIRLILLT